MAYECVISELKNVRPHPNADRVALANCQGFQVVVSLNSKEGDIVALFTDDGVLSEKFAHENNLYNKAELNKDKAIIGYFSKPARVRAQSFRKEKSEAFVCSLDLFKFTGYDISKLKIGDRFTELNGAPICYKYYTPATMRMSQTNKEKSSKKINQYLKAIFPDHKDTDNIRFARDENLQGIGIITLKCHGTSQSSGYLYWPEDVEIKNPFKKLWNVFCDEVLHGPRHIFNFWCNAEKAQSLKFYPEIKYEWTHVYKSRRVIKGKVDFKSSDYRNVCAAKIAPFVKKGEQWFYEIVGYEDNGAPIMQTVNTESMGKEFVKRFGPMMTYKYGCLPGTCDIYVYRITVQNADNEIYELPWSQVKARCNNAGIKHVPELATMLVKGDNPFADVEIAKLKGLIEYYTEEVDVADPIDPSHIREGACIRIESQETGVSKIWKSKAYCFKVLEGLIKNNPEYIDIEEIEQLAEEN